MKTKDARMKAINEFVSGIKMIKLNQWVHVFQQKVAAIRHQELQELKKANFCSIGIISFAFVTVPLVQGGTLTYYSLTGHSMEVNKIMSMLSTFKIIVSPIIMLPYSFAYLIQAYTSLLRLQAFFVSPEMDKSFLHFHPRDPQHPHALSLRQANFSWAQTQEEEEDEKKKKERKKKEKKEEKKEKKEKREEKERKKKEKKEKAKVAESATEEVSLVSQKREVP